MRQYDLIRAICDSMIMLGWGPYQNDHEDANGQFEMNWDFSNCLQTADRHVFLNLWFELLLKKKDCVLLLCLNLLLIKQEMGVMHIYLFGIKKEKIYLLIKKIIRIIKNSL